MTTLQAHQRYLADILERQKRRRKAIDPKHAFPPQPRLFTGGPIASGSAAIDDPTKNNVANYVPAEETVRNDYTAWHTLSGIPGSDYILGARDHEICEEYPALRRLMDLKAQLLEDHSHSPLYLPLTSAQPNETLWVVSPTRFDVILVTPSTSWEETAALPIRSLSADPSFVFLWVGRGDEEGLEKGRECFAKWGFRRAEDIVWVKTTNGQRSIRGRGDGDEAAGGTGKEAGSSSARGGSTGRGGLLASQKEHCLMGIRGTVRRSTDTRFAHCNVDTDVLLWEDEGDPDGPRHPPYLHTLIESFCLGTRRLQITPFSSVQPPILRRGWVTASHHPIPAHATRFDPNTYPSLLPEKSDGKDVLPFEPEIELLRPKSPTRAGKRSEPSFGGQNTINVSSGPSQPGRYETRGYGPGQRGSLRGRGRSGPRMDGRQPGNHHGSFALPPPQVYGMDAASYGYPPQYDPTGMAYQMAQLQLQTYGQFPQHVPYHPQQAMFYGQQYGGETLTLSGQAAPTPAQATGGYGEGWHGYGGGQIGLTHGMGQGYESNQGGEQGQW